MINADLSGGGGGGGGGSWTGNTNSLTYDTIYNSTDIPVAVSGNMTISGSLLMTGDLTIGNEILTESKISLLGSTNLVRNISSIERSQTINMMDSSTDISGILFSSAIDVNGCFLVKPNSSFNSSVGSYGDVIIKNNAGENKIQCDASTGDIYSSGNIDISGSITIEKGLSCANGVVIIDKEGNVMIDSCATEGCNGGDLHCEGIVSCADFKVYKNNEDTPSVYTSQQIEESLSGVMLWISDDGTFYKDEDFKFKNNIDIAGNCSCNAIIQASDQKLKSNIEHIQEKDIQNIMELEPVSFQWKKDIIENKNKDSTKKIYGFIAQDVQKKFPDIVDDSGDMLHMDYIQIIPLLLEKIKRIYKEQGEKNIEFERLKKEVTDMKSKMKQMEDMIQSLVNKNI